MITRAVAILSVAGTLLFALAPVPRLGISVEPSSSEMRGDTLRISYRVSNAATSASDLFMFTIDAPSPALRVEKPANARRGEHNTATAFGRSVASWGFMKLLAPGTTSPALTYSAVGLPGVVKYWATPFVAPDTVETPDVPLRVGAPVGPGNTAADSGFTAGIVPFPADRSRAALLLRLGTLTRDACARAWIDNAGVCNSLLVKIRQGNDAALTQELEAQRDKHVNATAYYLLLGNVRALPAK